MIIYDILLILQYQVSTTVMDFVVVFAWFLLMLVYTAVFLCRYRFFSVNKDLYIRVMRTRESKWSEEKAKEITTRCKGKPVGSPPAYLSRRMLVTAQSGRAE